MYSCLTLEWPLIGLRALSVINSMVSSAIWDEWLLIARGEAECNYANHAYILLVYNLQQIASH